MKPWLFGKLSLPLLALTTLLTCHVPMKQGQVAHAQNKTQRSKADFDPKTAKLPAHDPVFIAKSILEAGNPASALELLQKSLSENNDPLVEGRILWLTAKAASQTHQFDEARKALKQLSESNHPLKPWATLRLGELELMHDASKAETFIAQAKKELPLNYNLRSLHVRALATSGKLNEAVSAAHDLLARVSNHIGGASFLMPLADALSKSSKASDHEQALVFYHRVASRAPLSTEGQHAEESIKNLLDKLDERDRKKHDPWPIEFAIEKAEALYRSHAYEKAEEAFEAIIKRSSGAMQCKARYRLAKSQLNRKARKTGAPLMLRVAKQCKKHGYGDKALFNAARAYSNLDDNHKARILYAKLERQFPKSNLADDARYRSALLYQSDKQNSRAEQLLRSLPHRYPQGDMRGEAMFMLAWQAFNQKKYNEALSLFRKLLSQGAEADIEGMHGRSLYWLARSYELTKNRKKAIGYYDRVCNQWPMSFHCQWSLRRLQNLSAKRASMIKAAFKKSPHNELRFAITSKMKTDAFMRMLELLRVGEIDLAQRELSHQGFNNAASSDEELWLAAALLYEASAYAASIQIIRGRLRHMWAQSPAKENWPRWRLAYPLAFSPLMERKAAEQKVPVDLVRAIAREESSFEPTVVSVSRAYGLIQLIAPTAKKHAEALDLPYSPEDLKNPEINLPIGIHFLKSLLDRYQNHITVIPAAYNAGEGAVDRWLKSADAKQPTDQWIENIPYGQTRRYSRRVLQSYGIYHWLRYGEFPSLETKLPKGDF